MGFGGGQGSGLRVHSAGFKVSFRGRVEVGGFKVVVGLRLEGLRYLGVLGRAPSLGVRGSSPRSLVDFRGRVEVGGFTVVGWLEGLESLRWSHLGVRGRAPLPPPPDADPTDELLLTTLLLSWCMI